MAQERSMRDGVVVAYDLILGDVGSKERVNVGSTVVPVCENSRMHHVNAHVPIDTYCESSFERRTDSGDGRGLLFRYILYAFDTTRSIAIYKKPTNRIE